MKQLHFFLPSYVFNKIQTTIYPQLKLLAALHAVYEPTGSLVDRTETIKSPINIISNEKLNFDIFTDKKEDLGALVLDRANKISKIAREFKKRVNVMYSGGIDSTLVLAALMRTHCSGITVLMTPTSILENPVFYEKYIRPNYPIKSAFSMFETLTEDNIIVTGDFGDKINGYSCIVDNIRIKYGDVIKTNNYLPVIHSFFKDETRSKEVATQLLDYLQPLIDKCPRGVQTVAGYFWWLDLTLRWDSVYWKMYSYYPQALKKINNYIPFFDTNKFVNWSVQQEHVRYPEDTVSNKRKFKNLINWLSEDRKWDKVKVGSQCALFHGLPRVDSIDTDLIGRTNTEIDDYLTEK